jgi:ankyrin repeat protein
MEKDQKSFIRAAGMGDIEKVGLYLSKGITPNVQDQYQATALLYASRRGRIEVVKLLVENGADINLADDRKRTSFFHAVTFLRYDVVKYLADKKCNMDALDIYDWTALDAALMGHQLKMVALLKELGASANKYQSKLTTL